MKRDKLNPTTKVVRSAMKAVSKDVRKPKVVRDGIVKKKKETPCRNLYAVIPPRPEIAYILINDSFKLKKKNILSSSMFSHSLENISVPNSDWQCQDYVLPGKIKFNDVEVKFMAGDKKIQKLYQLFHEQKKVNFIMCFKDNKMIISKGFLSSISSWENDASFTYCPDHYAVL